ncbi:hypothetical protein [Paenibacillus sp. LjRoot56]|uniref:hypothetical protein n=1 Tax=Paenibacillus sp. LjRoot56 TaxID=3342333 RepID=UPI003ECC40BD
MRETQQVSKWRLVYIVMAAEFDGKSGIATLQDLHLYSYALCNVAEELINTEYRGIVIEARDGLVISFEDGKIWARYSIRITTRCRRCRTK